MALTVRLDRTLGTVEDEDLAVVLAVEDHLAVTTPPSIDSGN